MLKDFFCDRRLHFVCDAKRRITTSLRSSLKNLSPSPSLLLTPLRCKFIRSINLQPIGSHHGSLDQARQGTLALRSCTWCDIDIHSRHAFRSWLNVNAQVFNGKPVYLPSQTCSDSSVLMHSSFHVVATAPCYYDVQLVQVKHIAIKLSLKELLTNVK